jgi:protein TonB
MGKLHCILRSDGLLSAQIVLPASSWPRSFTRSVAGWLGLWRNRPLSWGDDVSDEDVSCHFDLSYQESTAFYTDLESAPDWDFEYDDLTFGDREPAIAFPDCSVLDDPDAVGLPLEEWSPACDQALVLDKSEFIADYIMSLSRPQPAREWLRSLAIGSLAHLAALSLLFAAPAPTVRGLGGISDKPIFVRLKEIREINTPDAPSPAAVDSPASAASLARRDPKPDETRIQKEFRKEPPAVAEPKKTALEPEKESPLVEAKSVDEPVLAHQKAPPDRSSIDGPPNDSKSLQDSVASMPSVASPERSGAVKAGDEAVTYRDRILAALHDAAYYPRAAANKRAHGKTVVCFTINKDGSLASVSIVSCSGLEILDEAAMKIVKKASSHFPPIPDALMKDQVSYEVPIVFKKRS